MEKLSVAVITLNEERNIGRCLQSVAGLADEIVVIDSLSTDQTEAICLSFGARFEPQAFKGYIEQKRHAIERCSHDFVLVLDADEALSETLKQSIQCEKEKNFPTHCYTFNRLTNYFGQWIYHSGWYPDQKLRLFHRSKVYLGGQNPHDRVFPLSETEKIAHLHGDLLHYSYYNVQEHYRQADRFATIAAKALSEKGKRSNYLLAAIKTLAKFIRNYILKAGFLDGRKGFVICKISALETWWKYTRLIHINRMNHAEKK